jgi:hypothetical protein
MQWPTAVPLIRRESQVINQNGECRQREVIGEDDSNA